MVDKKAEGKKNRIKGAKFEKKIREHFIGEGWMVDKWGNNIDLETEEIIHAKNFYIPGRGFTLGAGFPDFVMFRGCRLNFRVMFVECKMNGLLKKEEKEKCRVLQEKGCKVMIAYVDESQEDGFRLREFKYTKGVEKIPRGYK